MDAWFKTSFSAVSSIYEIVGEVAQQQVEGISEWTKNVVAQYAGGETNKDGDDNGPDSPPVYLGTVTQAYLDEIEVTTLSITKLYICHKCRGHGKIVSKRPCVDCDGQGSTKVRRRRIREISTSTRTRTSATVTSSAASATSATSASPIVLAVDRSPSPSPNNNNNLKPPSLNMKPSSLKQTSRSNRHKFRVVKISSDRRCDTCHGRGDIFESITCETCDGSGRGLRKRKSKSKGKAKAKEKEKEGEKDKKKEGAKGKGKEKEDTKVPLDPDCPSCNGVGKEISFRKCYACGGQGWLPCFECNMRGFISVPVGECKTCVGTGKVKGNGVFEVHIYESARDGQTMIFSFPKHVFAYKVSDSTSTPDPE